MEMGERIRRAREEGGLTQEQAAERLGVSRQTLSSWENGKTLPDLRSILAMSSLYRISLDELMKGDAKVMDKIQRDAQKAQDARRGLIVVGGMAFLVVALYLIGLAAGGALKDFMDGAMPYMMIGFGLLAVVLLQDSGKEERK